MAINFPSTAGQPTNGSYTYTVAGISYSWNGESWVAAVLVQVLLTELYSVYQQMLLVLLQHYLTIITLAYFHILLLIYLTWQLKHGLAHKDF